MTSPKEAIENYRPRADTCSADLWDAAGPLVRQAVADASVARTAKQVRPYLGTLTGLVAWLDAEGYDIDLDVAFAGPTIEAYVATLSNHQATHRSRLRKLAVGNGFDATAGVPTRYAKREFQPPYPDDDVQALWDYGRALTNQARGLSVCAVVALGTGCGLRSNEMRLVSAADVHDHDGQCCVRVGDRCVPVRATYADWVRYVAKKRPKELLVGNGNDRNYLARVSSWVRNQPGVPNLSVYRLRSTWLCALLVSDVAVTRIIAWAALTKYSSLDGYRQFLGDEDVTCPA